MEPDDVVAINQVLALYGHVIDERQWSRLDEVFTDDVVYDARDFGLPVTTSLAELREQWAGPDAQHPLAHHTTNVVVWQDDDGVVCSVSKAIGVGRKGRVGSATYRDVLRRTPAGWRLAERAVTLRRPETIPPAS